MENTITLPSRAKAYLTLLKPGIIFGNAITAAAGFTLAAKGSIDFKLFLQMLIGISAIIASGCAFNNYIDRKADQKMTRTKNRPLAKGAISVQSALVLALALVLLGTLMLLAINPLTAAIALFGFAVYVFFYSFLKYRTIHATLIGSIAGAVPPVVGYCAVSNQLNMGALLLFAIIVLWQMPHFYAIAIYRLNEYSAASIPVLPVKKGIQATKIQMFYYVTAFIGVSITPTLFHFTGSLYATVAGLLGVSWLWLMLKGFKAASDKLWARKMFLFSLIVVTVLCSVIPFSLVQNSP